MRPHHHDVHRVPHRDPRRGACRGGRIETRPGPHDHHTRRTRVIAILWLITLAAAGPLAAQEQLTVERIFGSRDFQADLARIQWMADGRHYTTVEYENGVTNLYRMEARSGARELLISGRDLVPPGDRRPILIQAYSFSADGSKLLIYTDVQPIWRYSTRGTYYVWDFEERRLIPASRESQGDQQYAKLSPDGRRVAFVRNGDLYVNDLATGRERALTDDGGDDILNGAGDWVYEEELRLYDAFRWGPDGERIAYCRFDRSPIRPFYLVDQLTLYPELRPVRYPKAGTQNSRVRIRVVELGTERVTTVDLDPGQEGYLARMDFLAGGDSLWIQRLNRHQNRMDLLLADVRTGGTRTVMTDRDSAWLDIHEPAWLGRGERFVYLSEAEGYARLYLYGRDGRRIRRLTDGDWDVLERFGVDEERGRVYFSAAADGPLQEPIYRVDLEGGGLRKISREPGSHDADFDPTFSLYVDTHSRAGTPPAQTLHSADGEPIRPIASNTAMIEAVQAAGIQAPEFLTVPSAESGVELNAYLIRPPDFDPEQEYPLLMYVYGGPGSQTVADTWLGERFLWHQLLAQQGYLVASVDNRGTGARGAEFRKQVYLRLGQLESADQIAAARHFANLPYVDGSRIGIWGWSYGGYMAALTVLRGADVFRTAISVAPVTDWRFYDTIYTERYMRTPRENPQGYERGSVLNYAERLQGHLLLVHGTGDDNVHPQNTVRLVKALEDANRQFDLRIYPNKAHGIEGATTRVNLFTLMTEYVKANL